jgi:hypothetical protein
MLVMCGQTFNRGNELNMALGLDTIVAQQWPLRKYF